VDPVEVRGVVVPPWTAKRVTVSVAAATVPSEVAEQTARVAERLQAMAIVKSAAGGT
jgi:hypothetical protein